MHIPTLEIGKTTISNLVDILADDFGTSKALVYDRYGIDHNFKVFRDICNDVAN